MPWRKRQSPVRRWPFWLLLAAWLCANSPQVAVFSVLTWLAEARSFSHQERLTVDVARLLGGAAPSRPIAAAVARAQEHVPAQPLPMVPADAVFKKLELSLEKSTDVLPVALRGGRHRAVAWVCPEPRRCAPPHGPPRVSLS